MSRLKIKDVPGLCNELANRFARGVWRYIPSEDDTSWLDMYAQQPFDPAVPMGDLGELVRRFRRSGLSDYEIARFAKLMCYDTAFGVCYYMGDSAADDEGDIPDSLEWEFTLIDESGERIGRIGSAHELLLGLDSSDRELRPRSN